MDLLFLLFVVLLRQEVGALKLLHISVSPNPLRGESALLVCRYDLESDKLYSITWYKDHEEFYRYVPRMEPVQHSYHLDGVKVDHHFSDNQQVLLQHVGLRTSGLFKCEVSAEGPNFPSVHGEAYMEVISLPQENPLITGEEKVYANGDILALNCTSGKSYPPARLKWFINDVQVRSDFESTNQQHGLISSISSLRLEIGPGHFINGRISVKCEATVQSSGRSSEPLIDLRETKVFVQGHASYLAPCLPLLASVVILHRLLLIA